MPINLSAPFNDLSIGNVTVCLAREMYERNLDVNIFPVQGQVHLGAYSWADEGFVKWIISKSENAIENISQEDRSLKIWHITGSETVLPNQTLFTFHEVEGTTKAEDSICRLQKNVIFSSRQSQEQFSKVIGEKSKFIPLAFDSRSFNRKPRQKHDKVIFGLIGKWEKRKNTERLISLWLKEFGNNPKYHLYCLVDNPFFQKEHQEQLKTRALGGNTWQNITFFERMKLNDQVNSLMNFVDIDIGGISNGEGWNLPSFNMTALGKYSIVTNYSAHKDWANDKNSILLESDGKQEIYDGFFFQKGQKFNQGVYSYISDEKIIFGFHEAIKRFEQNTVNEEGLKLANFTYSEMLDMILEVI